MLHDRSIGNTLVLVRLGVPGYKDDARKIAWGAISELVGSIGTASATFTLIFYSMRDVLQEAGVKSIVELFFVGYQWDNAAIFLIVGRLFTLFATVFSIAIVFGLLENVVRQHSVNHLYIKYGEQSETKSEFEQKIGQKNLDRIKKIMSTIESNWLTSEAFKITTKFLTIFGSFFLAYSFYDKLSS